MKFESTHNLPFESADWEFKILDQIEDWKRFRVGTCTGIWSCNSKNYNILAVNNYIPNSGHFADVLEWFENSCKRDKRNLVILEIMNQRFMKHLIDKKGFSYQTSNSVIKILTTNH